MLLIAPVPRPLRDVVRRVAAYDERAEVSVSRRQAPATTVTLVIGLGDPLRVDATPVGSFLAGLADTAAITEFRGHQAGVQVDLSPLGALRLLGAPLRALGPLRPLDDLRAEHRGRVPLDVLADEVGWSRRHLSRRFSAQVGIAPTTFARVLRFRRAADLLVPPAGADPATTSRIADVAAACGYADHSHLDREFRALAGCPPSTYVLEWETVGVAPSDVVDLGSQPGRAGR